MRIGINASFLRKPGTGIGQVSVYFLQTLAELIAEKKQFTEHTFILYCEEVPQLSFALPSNFTIKHFLPWWKRDDLLRKYLWEKQVAPEAIKDACDAFLSLYQSATVFPEIWSGGQPKTIRHTMVVHDIIPRLFSEYRGNMRQAFYWKMVERGIRAAQHIVAMSEHTKQDIVREFNIPEHTLSVAYPAVAPHFRVPITEETVKTVLQKYHLALGYIYHGGGLEVRKNTETVLRAYKVLVTKNPTLPPLVISGKIFPVSNALATDVRGLVATLGLQERVQLLGFIPDADLPALYKGARVFIYSSLYEGFGLPVLEALCVGVPTIASSAASLPEVGGNAVVYVNPHNVGAVAEAIERVINDRGTRETLIARGVSHIYQFRWDIFVQKIFAHIIQ